MNAVGYSSASAAACPQSYTSGTVQFSETGDYALWVRYRSPSDGVLQVEIDGTCYDVQMLKTGGTGWRWTSKNTIGASTRVTIGKTSSLTIKTYGTDDLEVDSYFFLKEGEICKDGTTLPQDDASNCKTAGVAATGGGGGSGHDHGAPVIVPPIFGDTTVSGGVQVGSANDRSDIPSEVRAGAIQVDYYVDGGLVASKNPDEGFSLDTRDLENGSHTLSTVITDGYGHSSHFDSSFSTSNADTPLTVVRRFFKKHNRVITLTSVAVVGAASLVGLALFVRKQILKRRILRNHGITTSYEQSFGSEHPILILPRLPLAAVAVLVVSVLGGGGVLLAAVNTSNSTVYTVYEAESATLTSDALKKTDAAALGATYVSFKRQSTTPPPTTSGGTSPAPSTGTGGGTTPTPTPTPTPTSADFPIIPTDPALLSTWRKQWDRIPPAGPEGAFRMICAPSHLNFDDPVIYPGRPGAAHLHTYFGNSLANANSTWTSLRSSGDGTCQSGPLNRSAYWAPSIYNGAGKVVMPDYAVVYYKGEADTVNLPRGLRYIAGFDAANPGQLYGAANPGVAGGSEFHPYWTCDGNVKITTIPNCPPNSQFAMVVNFPYCWNGQLDSANHRSHVVYPLRSGSTLYCPTTHPHKLPRYTLSMWYTTKSGDNMSQWYLSSDRMPGAMQYASGETAHADWFGAWDQTILELWAQECVREIRDCNASEYGDGTIGDQPKPWYWENPNRLVDPPAR